MTEALMLLLGVVVGYALGLLVASYRLNEASRKAGRECLGVAWCQHVHTDVDRA